MFVLVIVLLAICALSIVINFIILNAVHKKLLWVTEGAIEKYIAKGLVKLFPELVRKNSYVDIENINKRLERFSQLISDYERFYDVACNIRKETSVNLKEIKKLSKEARDIKEEVENINNNHLEKLKELLISDMCKNIVPEELFIQLLKERYRKDDDK